MRLAVCFLVCGTIAAKACEDGETLHFSCTVSGGQKTVQVCHSDTHARYQFGPTDGVPELELHHPIEDVGLTPWPGVGRTIWEEVTFFNAGHSYSVYGAIDRAWPKDDDGEVVVTLAGGVTVSKGDKLLASLSCDAGSVDFPWGTGLFDAKAKAGQCFDMTDRVWQSCPVRQ